MQLEDKIIELIYNTNLPAETIYYLLLFLANKVHNALLEQKLQDNQQELSKLQNDLQKESGQE